VSFDERTKVRSLLIGDQANDSFREYSPCYVHERTHVRITDITKYGEVYLTNKHFRNNSTSQGQAHRTWRFQCKNWL